MEGSLINPTDQECCSVQTKLTWPFLESSLYALNFKGGRYEILYHDAPLKTFGNFDK